MSAGLQRGGHVTRCAQLSHLHEAHFAMHLNGSGVILSSSLHHVRRDQAFDARIIHNQVVPQSNYLIV